MTLTKRETGKVRWFNAHFGYGFIRNKQGEDIFVHYLEIDNIKVDKALPNHYTPKNKKFKSLTKNDKVTYVCVGDRGNQRASEVLLVNSK